MMLLGMLTAQSLLLGIFRSRFHDCSSTFSCHVEIYYSLRSGWKTVDRYARNTYTLNCLWNGVYLDSAYDNRASFGLRKLSLPRKSHIDKISSSRFVSIDLYEIESKRRVMCMSEYRTPVCS